MTDSEKPTKTKADKTRVMVLFAFLLVLVAGIIFAYFGLKKHQQEKEFSAARLKRAPESIRSVPGLDTATEEYTKTQQQENLIKAQKAAERAEKQGLSSAAVPTVTRAAFRGGVSEFIATPSQADAPRPGCTQEEIKRAKAAGVSAFELHCKGCSARDLQPFFTPAELKQGGFLAADLKAAGASETTFKEAGFSAKELKELGYTTSQLKAAGYSAAELKAAGFTAEELRTLGIDPTELRAAGFTGEELLKAGVSVSELKNAGYSVTELKHAGASVQALSDTGFTPIELMEAGATDADLAKANIPSDRIKVLRADFDAKKNIPKDCTPASLSKAKQDGVSAAALGSLKCDAASLKAAGYTAEQLKAAGFSAKDLKAAGFSVAELKAGGFNAAELRAAGFSDRDLKEGGFSAAELKTAGLRAEELKTAGFGAGELKNAGFTPAELQQAGHTADDLIKAGLTADELRAAGYTVEQLKAGGVDPIALKKAGFTNGDLIRAGFTQQEIDQALLKADPARLRATGYGADQLKTAGFAADKLRTAGYTTAELLAAGYSAEDLKKAGFTDEELLQAGVSREEVARIKTAIAGTVPAPATGAQPAQQPSVAGAPATENAGLINIAPPARAADAYDPTDPEKVLERLQQRQAAQASGEQRDALLEKLQTSMATQVTGLVASWNPPPTQQYVAREADTDEKAGETGEAGARGGRAGEGGGNTDNTNIIKAGSVMFAVLDTGINSDENSPIMATIVEGPLKGARLLGQFTRTNKRVVLSFSTMSLPRFPTSISINTVAIDPDTARTAVASSVNSHYILRYGTLFASSFLTGFASAVAQSGAFIVQPPLGGNPIIAQPPLTTRDKVAVALGAVGTQYAAEMGKNFSRPPTVKVDPGTALGILFMADLPMPKEIPVNEKKMVQLDG